MSAQDKPKSKPATKEYRDNWERIFKKENFGMSIASLYKAGQAQENARIRKLLEGADDVPA